MHSATKLRRKSNVDYRVSPTPVFKTKKLANIEVGGRGGAYKYPAAGSRDEPTRLQVDSPVAERTQGLEAQVHKVFALENK